MFALFLCVLLLLCSPPLPIGMYAVSKTALLGLTKGLASELGTQDIRVNAVAPGIVPTKLSSYLVQSPELVRALAGYASVAALRCARAADFSHKGAAGDAAGAPSCCCRPSSKRTPPISSAWARQRTWRPPSPTWCRPTPPT